MAERNILLIVEGENEEPAFFKQLFNVCYRSQAYHVYAYKTNLHVLARKLAKEYPDFTTGVIEINRVLSADEPDEERKGKLLQEYTDIYMIFDFEPQDGDPQFDILRKMLMYFNDSVDRGKLFLNYPMMQSYKHFSKLPDDEFCEVTASREEWGRYKEVVNGVSAYKDVRKYTYLTFLDLAVHHLKKANYILCGRYEIPPQNEYLLWRLEEIFDKQLNNMRQADWIYVLNTCIFLLIDYNPGTFYSQLENKKVLLSL